MGTMKIVDVEGRVATLDTDEIAGMSEPAAGRPAVAIALKGGAGTHTAARIVRCDDPKASDEFYDTIANQLGADDIDRLGIVDLEAFGGMAEGCADLLHARLEAVGYVGTFEGRHVVAGNGIKEIASFDGIADRLRDRESVKAALGPLAVGAGASHDSYRVDMVSGGALAVIDGVVLHAAEGDTMAAHWQGAALAAHCKGDALAAHSVKDYAVHRYAAALEGLGFGLDIDFPPLARMLEEIDRGCSEVGATLSDVAAATRDGDVRKALAAWSKEQEPHGYEHVEERKRTATAVERAVLDAVAAARREHARAVRDAGGGSRARIDGLYLEASYDGDLNFVVRASFERSSGITPLPVRDLAAVYGLRRDALSDLLSDVTKSVMPEWEWKDVVAREADDAADELAASRSFLEAVASEGVEAALARFLPEYGDLADIGIKPANAEVMARANGGGDPRKVFREHVIDRIGDMHARGWIDFPAPRVRTPAMGVVKEAAAVPQASVARKEPTVQTPGFGR